MLYTKVCLSNECIIWNRYHEKNDLSRNLKFCWIQIRNLKIRLESKILLDTDPTK